ncbi:hypothetical protein GCM10022394_00370 [Zobellella aerophila]|uniref:Transposase DDE domain-containing protein n=1 Tax=Zobellella aerophila TaxID=870480 RepID=A0ABP6UZH4_9GAMM
MLKTFFGLPLRTLEGVINSIFQLMDVPLTSPGYSSISKRAKTVDIKYRLPSKGAVTHLVIDATGLKVFGEGEWKQHKHGKDKRRVWRKLHLAVDTQTHEVIAAEVSLETWPITKCCQFYSIRFGAGLYKFPLMVPTTRKTATGYYSKKVASPPFHQERMPAIGRMIILGVRQ